MAVPHSASVRPHTRRESSNGRRPKGQADLIGQALAVVNAYVQKGQALAPKAATKEDAPSHCLVDHVLYPRTRAAHSHNAEQDEVLRRTRDMLDEIAGPLTCTVFFRHVIYGHSYKHIAERLEISQEAVKRCMAKAICALALAGQGVELP